MAKQQEVSAQDIAYHRLIRNNVSNFVKVVASKCDREGAIVLDIAPQDHEGASPYFSLGKVETLDIDPSSGATYIADICVENRGVLPDNHFDVVVCTEVLEHTLNPFAATEEILRILKPGGIAVVSTPYNFRIHGPLPDCWRFTEHGLKELFKNYKDVKISQLDDPDRFLMPIHYTLTASKSRS